MLVDTQKIILLYKHTRETYISAVTAMHRLLLLLR
jgi:hypothetical protein